MCGIVAAASQTNIISILADGLKHLEYRGYDSSGIAFIQNKNISNYKKEDYELLLMQLSEGTALIQPNHFITFLFHKQDEPDFAKLFDDTLLDIAKLNTDIFSVKEDGGAKVILFDRVSEYVTISKRDDFCKAIINKLINFSFERIFNEKYDFITKNALIKIVKPDWIKS